MGLMEISDTAFAGNAGSASSNKSATNVGGDYETFLLMMTTQIKNQDPLEPMDASDFAVQLATFSGVEQQVKTNDILAALSAQMNLMGMAQMQGWIGNEVRFAAPVSVEGATPIMLSPNPAAIADKAVLIVRGSEGAVVARTEIPVGTADYAWTPTNTSGDPLADGIYTLGLESYADDALIGETEIEHYATVREVRAAPTGTTLLFDGGVEVPSLFVTALRAPVAAI
jgi:flagellar basal-body rod modification protein FlgD